jgi:hypothetical protein
LKSGLGLGHAQLTQEAARVERSVAITLLAYRVVLGLQAKPIKPGAAWSLFALKQKFAWDVGAQPIKRTTQQETLKEIKKLKLAACGRPPRWMRSLRPVLLGFCGATSG